jgi:hypothetical protein
LTYRLFSVEMLFSTEEWMFVAEFKSLPLSSIESVSDLV